MGENLILYAFDPGLLKTFKVYLLVDKPKFFRAKYAYFSVALLFYRQLLYPKCPSKQSFSLSADMSSGTWSVREPNCLPLNLQRSQDYSWTMPFLGRFIFFIMSIGLTWYFNSEKNRCLDIAKEARQNQDMRKVGEFEEKSRFYGNALGLMFIVNIIMFIFLLSREF